MKTLTKKIIFIGIIFSQFAFAEKIEKYSLTLPPTESFNFPSPQISVVWPMELIQADKAHQLPFSKGEGVRICMIDSGVDLHHPLLQGLSIEGKNFIENEILDDLGDTTDMLHGTILASILVGKKQGEFFGIAPFAKLIVAKIMDRTGAASVSSLIRAFEYCSQKSDIITITVGGDFKSKTLSALMAQAKKEGITIIAASGKEKLYFPANDPSVLAVSAIGQNYNLPDYGVRDSRLAFVAPGLNVPFMTMTGETRTMTSAGLSVMYVAGAEAIRRSRGAQFLLAKQICGVPEERQGKGIIDALLTALNTP